MMGRSGRAADGGAARHGGAAFAPFVGRTEDAVYVDDLDIPPGKLTQAAQRVIDRAIEESRRRLHPLLTSAHLFVALAQAEWDLFAHAMGSAPLNTHHV